MPYFPNSPFTQQIPNPPTVNANSAAWASALGTFSLNNLSATVLPSGNNVDHGEPIYYNHQGANVPVTIHCTQNYGNRPCNTEGMTVYIDPNERVQNNDVSGQDDHFAIIDPSAGYEYDFWRVQQWPPQNGQLVVGWSGRCSLGGNGFTNPSYGGPKWNSGCVSQASGTPISMGLVRANDILAALNNPHGTLPQAIAVGVSCAGTSNGSLPAPFLGSGDGHCSNAPLEGERLYLAMHDSDVNALGVAPITAVILRTLDEDHYGAVINDTGGPQQGIQLNAESDTTYTAFGMSGPFYSRYLPEAQHEGLPGSNAPYNNQYQTSLPIPASVASAVRFL